MNTLSLNQNSDIAPLLREIKHSMHSLFGHNFRKLILFGSYARNEQYAESDIDLLLLLEETTAQRNNTSKIIDKIYDLMLDSDKFISIIPASEIKYKNLTEPLYYNVQKEGIEI